MSAYMIQQILVPVDLSEPSLNALETAIALAIKNEASLTILNVIEQSYDLYSESSFSFLSNLNNSSDVLQALAGAIQHKSSLTPEIIQPEGNVADCIIRQSLHHSADLIVMGTHGASGFRDGFLGSNTYSVLKHAHCPVLTIPPRKKFTSFRKVLFPIRPVLGALARYDVLCHLLNTSSAIDVLGLSYQSMERETSVLDKLIEEVQPHLDLDKIKANGVWGSGVSVADDVLYHTQKSSPDLLVVTSGLDVISKQHFIGPYTQKIVNASKVPVLSIKKVGVPVM